MTKQARLETRVQVLEEKVKTVTKEWNQRFEKRLEERFRAEGEMMDQRFANLYSYMDRRFDGVELRFDGVDQRLAGIDQRLDRVDQRFDRVDERFDGIDHRFDTVDKELKVLGEGLKTILAKLA